MAKGFSGSTIKSWFQYRCERKVRFELSSNEELAAVPVAKDVRQASWAALGTAYETRVVARLNREEGVRAPSRPREPLDESSTTAFLRGSLSIPYVAQANLTPRGIPAFLKGTGLSLNRNLPDLIRRSRSEGAAKNMFTIVDVKATRRATAFHKTQVAFYVRVLEELLRELDTSSPTNAHLDNFGEVWRIPDNGTAEGDAWEIERFALAPYLRLVDEFCNDVLPGIGAKKLGPGVDQTFFHLYFKCEQCEYLGHCSKSIAPDLPPERRDVSAVPGLTHEGKRALHRLKIRSVADLAAASGLAGAPGIGWSLSRRAVVLAARARALTSDAILRTDEEHTFLMPPRADAMLLLSVDHDPVDDRIAAIGYRRIQDGGVRHESIEVPASGSMADEAEVMIRVLSALILDLTEIDQANGALPTGSPDARYAHIFFYEPAEAANLQRAIGRHLDNEVIRAGLLHLVRLFPPEDIVPEPEFRGVHHLPATAIRSVLRAVCQNRNLWGVEDFEEITIRHSKYAASRFAHQVAPALTRFANSSPLPFVNGIRAARENIVARSDDDRTEFLRKRGFSKTETAKIIDIVLTEEGHKPESVFDFVQGITAMARNKPHQDARLDLEAKAKKLFDRAA